MRHTVCTRSVKQQTSADEAVLALITPCSKFIFHTMRRWRCHVAGTSWSWLHRPSDDESLTVLCVADAAPTTSTSNACTRTCTRTDTNSAINTSRVIWATMRSRGAQHCHGCHSNTCIIAVLIVLTNIGKAATTVTVIAAHGHNCIHIIPVTAMHSTYATSTSAVTSITHRSTLFTGCHTVVLATRVRL